MMEMMGMFSGMFAFLMFMPLIIMGAFIPVLVYLVARWRNANENAEQPDTQIGLKVALHLFRVLGFQLTLAAVFLFLLAIISEIPTGDTIRIALGIGVPSGGVFFAHHMLAQKTNGATFPAVARMFDGWNLVVTGFPGFMALVGFFVVIFADTPGSKGDILRVVAPYMMAYTGAWVFLGFTWFKQAGLLPQGPAPGTGSMPPGGGGGYDPNYAQQPQQQQYQQPGYQAPPAQGGYPPQGAPQPQGGGYPPQGTPQGGGGYPPQGGGGQPGQ